MTRRVGHRVSDTPVRPVPPPPPSSRRLRQTLALLLDGLDKRQIARRMGLSTHTVHGYIRAVYRHYGVTTRARLMAIWVRRE